MTAEKEIQQLREKITSVTQDTRWQMPAMSVRVIQACFDIQKRDGLSDEKTVAGMALALASALDNSEKMVMDYVTHALPSPIIMCAECPRKEAVLKSLSKE